jgi:guanylate kinase
MNIDVQGVESLKRAAEMDPLLAQRLVTVFLIPENFEELQKRLTSRGKDDADEIQRRLVTAKAEVKHWEEYDFCITSGSKEEDFAALRRIWEEEKKRTCR